MYITWRKACIVIGVLGSKKGRKECSFFRSAWNVDFVFELYDIEQRDVSRLSWLVDVGQGDEFLACYALSNENQTSFDNLDGDDA